MTVIGTATLRLLGDTAQFRSELTGASAHWAKTGKQLESAGDKLTSGVTLPIAALTGAVVALGSTFESEMSKIVGLVGISQEQVDEWSQQLLKLGPEVGKSPRELAEALFFVTSAGFRGAEAIDVLTISAKASAAGLGDTATIADALTSAINAYGIENLSASESANILTAAVREGKLEASQLAPVLGQVLPTASALGITFQDVAGTLAVFSRTGVNAARGVTSLNAIMSTMLKTSKEGEDALAGVGLTLEDLREQAAGPGGMIGVMRTLDSAFEGNNEELVKVIPNIEAFRGVMNALAQDGETVDAVMNGVADSTGSLEHAFEAAADTSKFKMNAALSEMSASLIKLSATVLPPVASALAIVADLTSDVADIFSGLPGPVRSAAVAMLGLLAAAGPILVVAGKLVSAWGLVTAAFPAVAVAVAAVATPITLAVAAFASLVAAGMALVENWNIIKFEAQQFTEKVTGAFAWMYDKIVGHSYVPDLMNELDKEFGGLDKLMVAPAEEATQAVTRAFASITTPAKIKGIDYKVSIDANQLYGAVIAATGSAATAFNALSDEIPPTAELFVQLQEEIDEMEAPARDWVKVAQDMNRAALDNHAQILASTRVEKLAADQMKTLGNEAVTMSAKGQAALERINAERKRLVDSQRIQRAVTETLSQASEETSFKFQALQRSTASIISDFSPLGMLAEVLGSALDALKPAFDALKAPLQILGTILASAIMPILKALFPVIKFLSIAASYVVEGFLWLAGVTLKVVGWLQKALGTFVFGLGKILSKIPLIGGIFKPLKAAGKAQIQAGEAIMGAGDGMLDAIADIKEGREEIKALEWPAEAEQAAQSQISATHETTNATKTNTEVVQSVGSDLLEVANGILEATLAIRDLMVQGVEFLSLMATPAMAFGTAGPLIATTGGPSALLPGTEPGTGTQVSIGEGAVQINVGERDDPRAAGIAAADGFMERVSGREYQRTRRTLTGSGKIDGEI
jgi:TP901 family phage tail tape measure protein